MTVALTGSYRLAEQIGGWAVYADVTVSATGRVQGGPGLFHFAWESCDMRQLVGSNCALCGDRFRSELGAKFCDICEVPVHIACAESRELVASESACPGCGARVAQKDAERVELRQQLQNKIDNGEEIVIAARSIRELLPRTEAYWGAMVFPSLLLAFLVFGPLYVSGGREKAGAAWILGSVIAGIVVSATVIGLWSYWTLSTVSRSRLIVGKSSFTVTTLRWFALRPVEFPFDHVDRVVFGQPLNFLERFAEVLHILWINRSDVGNLARAQKETCLIVHEADGTRFYFGQMDFPFSKADIAEFFRVLIARGIEVRTGSEDETAA